MPNPEQLACRYLDNVLPEAGRGETTQVPVVTFGANDGDPNNQAYCQTVLEKGKDPTSPDLPHVPPESCRIQIRTGVCPRGLAPSLVADQLLYW